MVGDGTAAWIAGFSPLARAVGGRRCATPVRRGRHQASLHGTDQAGSQTAPALRDREGMARRLNLPKAICAGLVRSSCSWSPATAKQATCAAKEIVEAYLLGVPRAAGGLDAVLELLRALVGAVLVAQGHRPDAPRQPVEDGVPRVHAVGEEKRPVGGEVVDVHSAAEIRFDIGEATTGGQLYSSADGGSRCTKSS